MSDENLVKQLKRHEGFRSKPYKDTVGKSTIGYGCNLDDRGITEQEAEYILLNDVKKIRAELSDHDVYKNLSPERQDVLVNMAFNMGLAGLFKFKRTLKSVEEGEYVTASKQMLESKWARQVGRRAVELADQMRTGRYKD